MQIERKLLIFYNGKKPVNHEMNRQACAPKCTHGRDCTPVTLYKFMYPDIVFSSHFSIPLYSSNTNLSTFIFGLVFKV